MTAPENPHKLLAQQRKATKLADVLALQKGATPEVVAKMDRAGWDAACKLAGVAWPSDEVRAMVVDALRYRMGAEWLRDSEP